MRHPQVTRQWQTVKPVGRRGSQCCHPDRARLARRCTGCRIAHTSSKHRLEEGSTTERIAGEWASIVCVVATTMTITQCSVLSCARTVRDPQALLARAFLAHLATKGTTESLPVDSITWSQSSPLPRTAEIGSRTRAKGTSRELSKGCT